MSSAPANVGPTFLAINWTCFLIASIIVALRFYSRAFRMRTSHKDDYLMLAAWLLTILYGGLLSDAVAHGLGKHIKDIPSSNLYRIELEIALSRAPAIIIPLLVRVSFSCTLLLILRGTRHDKIRFVIWSNVVVETIVSTVNIIVSYAHCGSHFSPAKNGVLCKPSPTVDYVSYVQSGINCISTIVLASIPFWLIRKMNLPQDVKNGTIVLSILGFAAFIASIAKAVETGHLNGDAEDITYDFALLQLAVTLENSILMILCSLPLLRPLYKRDQNRNTIPITTNQMGRVTPTPSVSLALQEHLRHQPLRRRGSCDKDTESQDLGSNASDERIVEVLPHMSKATQRVSLDDADIPPDRIKVHTAVDVTYEHSKGDEELDTDEVVQQRIMFGL